MSTRRQHRHLPKAKRTAATPRPPQPHPPPVNTREPLVPLRLLRDLSHTLHAQSIRRHLEIPGKGFGDGVATGIKMAAEHVDAVITVCEKAVDDLRKAQMAGKG